jgi:hypothetical protein
MAVEMLEFFLVIVGGGLAGAGIGHYIIAAFDYTFRRDSWYADWKLHRDMGNICTPIGIAIVTFALYLVWLTQ